MCVCPFWKLAGGAVPWRCNTEKKKERNEITKRQFQQVPSFFFVSFSFGLWPSSFFCFFFTVLTSARSHAASVIYGPIDRKVGNGAEKIKIKIKKGQLKKNGFFLDPLSTNETRLAPMESIGKLHSISIRWLLHFWPKRENLLFLFPFFFVPFYRFSLHRRPK